MKQLGAVRLQQLDCDISMWSSIRRYLATNEPEALVDVWQAPISELLQLLDELRKLDPNCLHFGASIHRYALRPTFAESRLSALETLYHVLLPDDYRAFLRYAGDWGAGPGCGLFSFEDALPQKAREDPSALAAPFPHVDAYNLLDGDDTANDSLVGCLLLSDQGCGYADFLVVTGPTRGQVWTDGRGSDQGFAPLFATFYDWYLAWLQRSLRDLVGM